MRLLFNFVDLDYLDVEHLLKEVQDNEDLFGSVPLRTSYEGSAHTEVQDILLRGPEIGGTLVDLQNAVQCYNYPVFDLFPEMYEHVLDLMSLVRGEQLGRVIITKLPPKGKIHEHIDTGDAAEFYTRYHTVLDCGDFNYFYSGDEYLSMQKGHVYYVNNHIPHRVENDSNKDRIHLICDIQ